MLTKDKFLHYDAKTIPAQQAGAVPLPEWTNGFTVENTGNTDVLIDDNIIVPGDFKAFGGNYGEIFVGDCTLKFALPAIPPLVPVNSAMVTAKFYVNYNY